MREVSSLRQGDHVCTVYESPEQQLRVIAQYIKAGLDGGERCLYIVDDRSTDDVLDALHAAGADPATTRDSRRLILLTKRETYLQRGSFDPNAMIWSLAAMADQAVADGCSGLRITGEMTWALGPETGPDQLIEYETRLNEFFPGSRAHAICQYNRTRFAPSMIRDVLRMHPLALVGQHLHANPYYEPPEIARLPVDHPRRVDHMLAQIERE